MKSIIVRKCSLHLCRHHDCGWCCMDKIHYDEVNMKCLDYERSQVTSPGEWAQRIWNKK